VLRDLPRVPARSSCQEFLVDPVPQILCGA
jgi:hypothetical protein